MQAYRLRLLGAIVVICSIKSLFFWQHFLDMTLSWLDKVPCPTVQWGCLSIEVHLSLFTGTIVHVFFSVLGWLSLQLSLYSVNSQIHLFAENWKENVTDDRWCKSEPLWKGSLRICGPRSLEWLFQGTAPKDRTRSSSMSSIYTTCFWSWFSQFDPKCKAC